MIHTIDDKDLTAAFTEWDRRYREDPEEFDTAMSGEDYGTAASAYLLEVISDVKKARL